MAQRSNSLLFLSSAVGASDGADATLFGAPRSSRTTDHGLLLPVRAIPAMFEMLLLTHPLAAAAPFLEKTAPASFRPKSWRR